MNKDSKVEIKEYWIGSSSDQINRKEERGNLAIDESELRGTSLAMWGVGHPIISSQWWLRRQSDLLQHLFFFLFLEREDRNQKKEKKIAIDEEEKRWLLWNSPLFRSVFSSCFFQREREREIEERWNRSKNDFVSDYTCMGKTNFTPTLPCISINMVNDVVLGKWYQFPPPH